MNEALSKAIAALERIAETNASKHGTTPMMLERCLSTAREALSALLALQEARPVAYAYGTGLHWADQFPDTDEAEATALYAHPQPAQQDARDER